ncbi:carbohydrate ABC transporter permease [Cucumibacter marinus]|uniref:carbohydrate ABC transporter permease n=1 Tax=Cucumibacter marinus TaxID=1121252 RepID=UPI0003FB014C|nr:sugar ABC transporter permease [Cucumibacter marinus]
MERILITLLWTVAALAVTLLYFVISRWLVERLSPRAQKFATPFVFAGPAVILLFLFYLLPTALTILQSFQHPRSGDWVGLANYQRAFNSSAIRATIFNTLLWIVFVPFACVLIGLVAAGLTDRLSRRVESFVKTIIFVPMAISFVGAATIWGLVYAFSPPDTPQVGLINQIVVMLGGTPRPWLIVSDYKLNTFALMFIMVWLFAGFAMVNLSAAIKGVPDETIEAARLEGASGFTIFWRIIVPQIKTTIFTVVTAIALLTLKVFDVVYSLTGGRFDTDVIGNRFYLLAFTFRDRPLAAVLVVILLLLVIPVMIANLKQFSSKGHN